MSLAAETREAVRERPFLHTALRAGVVNYTAAAELLGLDGDTDAVATALRRFAADLPPYEPETRTATVRIRSGLGRVVSADGGEPLLSVAGVGFAPDAETADQTALVAVGDVDAAALRAVLGRLATAEVDVTAAGVTSEALVVVVEKRSGAGAVRLVEAALGTVDDGERES
jgi:hypothetical protein